MIYTLTLNPSVDYLLFTDKLNFGETNRSTAELLTFGGKGINVSRVLHELDIESVMLGFIAGFTGDALASELKLCGMRSDFIRLKSGVTRINVKINTGCETELNASGPKVSADEYFRLMSRLKKLRQDDVLVMSGSIPPSLGNHVYADIAKEIAFTGVRIIVDAEGEALANTLKYRPFLIKPNLRELEGLTGKTLTHSNDVIEAANELRIRGARNVLVSLGEKGAVLLDETGKTHVISAPDIQAVNTVGAGDSMLAGFIAAFDRGYCNALKFAVCVGSATASVSGLAKREDIERLCKSV